MKTQEIMKSPATARERYRSAREAKWFAPVVSALQCIAGPSGACMYCSCNEPSEIDHYRPMSLDPVLALTYTNLLWTCGVCNRTKGDRFPPDTEAGALMVNPVDDSVWEHFFLDPEYGRLIPAWDAEAHDYDARGLSTCEVVGVDRQFVQDRRMARLKAMKAEATALLQELDSGSATPEMIGEKVREWLTDPFQPDVADYFVRGPGRKHEPFATVLAKSALSRPKGTRVPPATSY